MTFICLNCELEFDWEDSPSEEYCVGCYTLGGVLDEEALQ